MIDERQRTQFTRIRNLQFLFSVLDIYNNHTGNLSSWLSLIGYYYIDQQVVQPLKVVTLQINQLEEQFAKNEQVTNTRLDSIESDVAKIEIELASLDARLESCRDHPSGDC